MSRRPGDQGVGRPVEPTPIVPGESGFGCILQVPVWGRSERARRTSAVGLRYRAPSAVLRAVIHIDCDTGSPLARSRPALRQAASDRESPAAQLRTLSGQVPAVGCLSLGEAERFGMDPAVVLGQDFADRAWPVGEGAVADLAARNR